MALPLKGLNLQISLCQHECSEVLRSPLSLETDTRGHCDWAAAVAFSPDGKILLHQLHLRQYCPGMALPGHGNRHSRVQIVTVAMIQYFTLQSGVLGIVTT
jgi:hypothetical protein